MAMRCGALYCAVVVYCHSDLSVMARLLFRAQDRNMTNGDFAWFTYWPRRSPRTDRPWTQYGRYVDDPNDLPRRQRAFYAVKQVLSLSSLSTVPKSELSIRRLATVNRSHVSIRLGQPIKNLCSGVTEFFARLPSDTRSLVVGPKKILLFPETWTKNRVGRSVFLQWCL